MRLARHLYRAARIFNSTETVLSGNPERVGKRAGNVVRGRALARTGFWNWLWGPSDENLHAGQGVLQSPSRAGYSCPSARVGRWSSRRVVVGHRALFHQVRGELLSLGWKLLVQWDETLRSTEHPQGSGGGVMADANLIDEALRLLAAGRVVELPGVRVFRVREPEETHTAVLTGAGMSGVACSCDPGRRSVLCVHVAASRLFIDRKGLGS